MKSRYCTDKECPCPIYQYVGNENVDSTFVELKMKTNLPTCNNVTQLHFTH